MRIDQVDPVDFVRIWPLRAVWGVLGLTEVTFSRPLILQVVGEDSPQLFGVKVNGNLSHIGPAPPEAAEVGSTALYLATKFPGVTFRQPGPDGIHTLVDCSGPAPAPPRPATAESPGHIPVIDETDGPSPDAFLDDDATPKDDQPRIAVTIGANPRHPDDNPF